MTDAGKRKVRVAAGIVWRGDGRFLAARRPAGKPRAGYWEFPGGKQEAGESMEETLHRELEEELGISCGGIVCMDILSHEYSEICVELHFMHVTRFTGEPEANDGQELRWVSPEEALSLNFLPADKAVLECLSPPKCGRFFD